jgi:transmembrane sensor
MNDDLLVKYLLGEANSTEKESVVQWIKEDDSHLKYFNHFKFIWDTSKQLAAKSEVDENAAWERFQQRMQQPAQKSIVRSIGNRFSWLRVAVILLVVFISSIVAWYVWNDAGLTKQIAVTTANNILKDTLSDGSVVTLNKHSEIYYPQKFKGNKRAITLKGEAFFEVTANKNKPFIVTVNDVTVTVVGTSFNIKNKGGKTEIIVETGIVKVTHHNKTIDLHPKEKTIVSETDTALQQLKVGDRLYNHYRTQSFVCDNTPLWQLVEVLKEAYGADIVIARNELRSLPLTSTFNEETLDRVLEIVAGSLDLKIERNNGQIILK